MTYSETLHYLYASQPAFHQVGAKAYKPGLDNTLRLMEHLGNPHQRFRSVHVAGTNGKGSTSHLIAAVLQKAGYKVGLYTSPHLVDFRERIRINGAMIAQADVVRFVEENKTFLEEVRPSFFETTMALAFAYFAAEEVDIAVIEVGLGGRLDSTNVIVPEVSVITNIGIDHTEFLGNTLAEIASEKAGIIKAGVPVVIGETHAETKGVFVQKARDAGCEVRFAEDVLRDARYEDFPCELQGFYQAKNKRTAGCALQILRERGWTISDEAIREGYAEVCRLTGLRGRWEVLQDKPLIVCDTGHNSHGIQYVAEQLQKLMQERPLARCYMVFGMVDDKDVEVVLDLLPKEAHYYFTQAETKRAIPADRLREMGGRCGLQGGAYGSVREALVAAREMAVEEDVIFIGGSNYVVGEGIQLIIDN